MQTIDPYFVYLNWRKENPNKRVNYENDSYDTVTTLSSTGPYKNVYAE